MDDFRPASLSAPSGTQSQPLNAHQGLASQQYHGSHGQHTLPPLHGASSQFTSLSSLYGQGGSAPQTPLTPQTPSSTAPSHNASVTSIAPHPPLRPLQPSPSYLPYASSQSGALPSSTALSAPHLSAAAPFPAHLQDLRPMPQGMMGLAGQFPQSQLYGQPAMLPNQEPEPVHVVGQQGRRGVLPTHPGRPAPTVGKAPTNPTKNADNKFECPHCNKTYLHLKHLKRHLLRRRYTCPPLLLLC